MPIGAVKRQVCVLIKMNLNYIYSSTLVDYCTMVELKILNSAIYFEIWFADLSFLCAQVFLYCLYIPYDQLQGCETMDLS